MKSLITPERPFGVYFYSIFEQFYQLFTGHNASSFRFIHGTTLFSTNKEVIFSCIAYFVVIFGGQALMKNRPSFKLSVLFQIHNVLLALVSAILLVLIVEQIFPKLYHHGFLYAICDSGGWTQPLELLYYLNYLVKYWELIDTVFLVLKKKKLEFLHYYHHSLTMVLCYTQLNGKTAVSWVPIILNLTVHVLMYYYYYRTASGYRVWWKKYLTTFQITQFIIDLFIVYFCTYTYFSHTYWPKLPNMGGCAGTEASAIFGCALLSSYLFLFINFYKMTYHKIQQGIASTTNRSKVVKSGREDAKVGGIGESDRVLRSSSAKNTPKTTNRKSKKI